MESANRDATPVDAPSGLVESLGVKPEVVARSKFDFLVEVDSEKTVRELRPDLAGLSKIQSRGVIVTSKASTQGFDFVSRFFAPQSGVDEDPATGSSHCALGPFWRNRLGRETLLAYQASSRGGIIRVTTKDDRVLLGGKAVTVVRGELVA